MTLAASRSTTLLPVLLIVIAMISIQSGAALAKSLFPLVGATGVTALRLVFGAIILCLIFKPWRMRFHSNRLPLLVYGLTLGGMNFLFYLSIRTIPLGVAVALEFTGPLVVAVFSSRRVLDFLWILLALLGLWFLLPLGSSIANVDMTGALCALGAGACWAFYILFGKKAGSNHGAGTAAIGALVAAIAFAPIGAFYATTSLFSLALLPLGITVAILSTALPYALEMVALTRLPARTFSTLMSLEPALAALSGILFLGEHLLWVQWLALACIIGASLGATLTVKPAETASA